MINQVISQILWWWSSSDSSHLCFRTLIWSLLQIQVEIVIKKFKELGCIKLELDYFWLKSYKHHFNISYIYIHNCIVLHKNRLSLYDNNSSYNTVELHYIVIWVMRIVIFILIYKLTKPCCVGLSQDWFGFNLNAHIFEWFNFITSKTQIYLLNKMVASNIAQ